MKTKKLSKKVLRFVELATEFEKTEIQIFGSESQNASTITNINLGSVIYAHEPKGICVTRGQAIMVEAENKKAQAGRYDEYQALKRELRNYFEASLTINK